MSYIVAALIFGLIVIIHELGHFVFARIAGIKVEEFAVGMGPKLISKQFGETYYSLRAVPFGGFCKMLGEDEAVEADGRSYSEKTAWQRFWVIFGGPLFNFILAFVFACIYLTLVGGTTRNIVDVDESMPAYEAGLLPGDKIVGFNDHYIISPNELILYLNQERPAVASITVKRQGEKITYDMTPVKSASGRLMIGIRFEELNVKNPFKLIGGAATEVAYWIRTVVYSLSMMLSGGVSKDDVAGPVGLVGAISEGYTESAKYGFTSVLSTMAWFVILLSSNLGVMNLLPIPALDGGRLVFILIEAIRGKPVDPDKEGMIHFFGYVALMALMVFIVFNDISKFFR